MKRSFTDSNQQLAPPSRQAFGQRLSTIAASERGSVISTDRKSEQSPARSNIPPMPTRSPTGSSTKSSPNRSAIGAGSNDGSPPRSDTSASGGSGGSPGRARSKSSSYVPKRPPQPQSLNAAVEKFASSPGSRTSTSENGNGHRTYSASPSPVTPTRSSFSKSSDSVGRKSRSSTPERRKINGTAAMAQQRPIVPALPQSRFRNLSTPVQTKGISGPIPNPCMSVRKPTKHILIFSRSSYNGFKSRQNQGVWAAYSCRA